MTAFVLSLAAVRLDQLKELYEGKGSRSLQIIDAAASIICKSLKRCCCLVVAG